MCTKDNFTSLQPIISIKTYHTDQLQLRSFDEYDFPKTYYLLKSPVTNNFVV